MSATLRRFALQQVRQNVRKSSYKVPANFKPVTMDDLPVPSGSWQTDYNAKQAKYNKHLVLGTGFLIFSLIVMKTSNLVQLNVFLPPFPVKE